VDRLEEAAAHLYIYVLEEEEAAHLANSWLPALLLAAESGHLEAVQSLAYWYLVFTERPLQDIWNMAEAFDAYMCAADAAMCVAASNCKWDVVSWLQQERHELTIVLGPTQVEEIVWHRK
jgi:hypothetical protein